MKFFIEIFLQSMLMPIQVAADMIGIRVGVMAIVISLLVIYFL